MTKQKKSPDRLAMEQFAADYLREVRAKLKLTQNELADLLAFKSESAVHPKNIYRWEAGVHPVPGWVVMHLQMVEKEIGIVPEEKAAKGIEPFVMRVMKKVRAHIKKDT